MELLKNWRWSVYFLLTMSLSACMSDRDRRHIPDVSAVVVTPEFRRFEQQLFELDTTQLQQSIADLMEGYPEFSEIYFTQILKSPNPNSGEAFQEFIKGFIKHSAIGDLYQKCEELYGGFSPQKEQLTQAFQFLKYYFPKLPTPDVTTFISEYGVGNFIYKDQSLAVGLDFFLGASYPYAAYNQGNPNFSKYLTRTFNEEHLVYKTLLPLVEDLVGDPQGGRLLDLMVHNGKKLYIMDHLLPYTPDSIKLEMTPDQVKWLNGNELEMWAFFLKEDLLYSSEWMKITKYLNYSPHSPGMPPEAPGRTANWMGWQIVSTYMSRFPEKTMQDLIAMKDAQEIMDLSKYKPRRR